MRSSLPALSAEDGQAWNAMALARFLSAGLRSHRQRSRLPQEVARRGGAVAHAYGWANRFAGDRPQIERRKLYGSARWLCVDRVRQESGFGKAADRPPYDQKRTLEATNGTSQIDVKRPLRIATVASRLRR